MVRSQVDLPVPRGPKRKKLSFGDVKNLGIIDSIMSLKMDLSIPK
jgi:hypothetical protein